MVALLAVLGVATTTGCKKKIDASTVQLSKTFRTNGGFAIVAYPHGMTATQVTPAVAELRSGSSGLDPSAIVFVAVLPKVDVTLDGFVEQAHALHSVNTKAWTEQSRTPTTCLGKYAGTELVATFEGDDGRSYRYWSCDFVENKRGFHVAYAVPAATADTDAPVLRKIADAVRASP